MSLERDVIFILILPVWHPCSEFGIGAPFAGVLPFPIEAGDQHLRMRTSVKSSNPFPNRRPYWRTKTLQASVRTFGAHHEAGGVSWRIGWCQPKAKLTIRGKTTLWQAHTLWLFFSRCNANGRNEAFDRETKKRCMPSDRRMMTWSGNYMENDRHPNKIWEKKNFSKQRKQYTKQQNRRKETNEI